VSDPSPLAGLARLEMLFILASDKEVELIRKALPNCSVVGGQSVAFDRLDGPELAKPK